MFTIIAMLVIGFISGFIAMAGLVFWTSSRVGPTF